MRFLFDRGRDHRTCLETKTPATLAQSLPHRRRWRQPACTPFIDSADFSGAGPHIKSVATGGVDGIPQETNGAVPEREIEPLVQTTRSWTGVIMHW